MYILMCIPLGCGISHKNTEIQIITDKNNTRYYELTLNHQKFVNKVKGVCLFNATLNSSFICKTF
jgi:hypothetical protein